jgi:hypothetical protein
MRQPVDKLRSGSFRALSRPRSASLLGKILIKSWDRDGMRSCVESGTAFSTVADALTRHRVRLTPGRRERRKVGSLRAMNPFNSVPPGALEHARFSLQTRRPHSQQRLDLYCPRSLCPATKRKDCVRSSFIIRRARARLPGAGSQATTPPPMLRPSPLGQIPPPCPTNPAVRNTGDRGQIGDGAR